MGTINLIGAPVFGDCISIALHESITVISQAIFPLSFQVVREPLPFAYQFFF